MTRGQSFYLLIEPIKIKANIRTFVPTLKKKLFLEELKANKTPIYGHVMILGTLLKFAYPKLDYIIKALVIENHFNKIKHYKQVSALRNELKRK